jgi:hypothetical protein
MPQCFDINNVPQDCASASDVGQSSCFDDTGQEVSCAEVGGYVNPSAPSVPVNANPTGLLAATAPHNNAGTSLTSALVSLGAIGSQTFAQTQAPSTTLRVGPGGVAVPQANISTGLLLIVAAITAFLIFRPSK